MLVDDYDRRDGWYDESHRVFCEEHLTRLCENTVQFNSFSNSPLDFGEDINLLINSQISCSCENFGENDSKPSSYTGEFDDYSIRLGLASIGDSLISNGITLSPEGEIFNDEFLATEELRLKYNHITENLLSTDGSLSEKVR